MARRLSNYFVLREDRVATRALSDILGKAVQSGQLSDLERQWAHKLMKAIEKSGPDSLVYPKLSFDAGGPEDKPKAKGKAKAEPEPKRGIDLDPSQPDRTPDPAMDKAQAAWDKFANYPTKAADVELGAAGAPKAQPDEPVAKKPGMLSRIFKGKGERKPGAAVSQSTWDDLSHSGPKAPEPRNKAKATPKSTWDKFANQGPKGERK